MFVLLILHFSGWHICSTCMKASHYLCYTCTFSSCKGCINNADYVCVRGNKGFCGTCKRTILLIENHEGNKEGVRLFLYLFTLLSPSLIISFICVFNREINLCEGGFLLTKNCVSCAATS